MVEIHRVDIAVEALQLSLFIVMPQWGHMMAALHIMSYLKIKHNSRIILDPTYATVNYDSFKANENWTAFYGDAEEALPLKIHSNHAGDKSTRRSRTGFRTFMNMAMIDWHTKKQRG